MVLSINPLCFAILICQTVIHLPLVSSSSHQLINLFDSHNRQPDETHNGLTTINRIKRQIEDGTTTQLTTNEMVETTTKFIKLDVPSTISNVDGNYDDDDDDDDPITTKISADDGTIKPEKPKTTKDKLDAFLAGPLIIVGAISLVSLCLFLLYVCKYRSTGSSGDFVPETA